jgi:trimethylamine:corrinoid methyltransferase-like protein
VADRLSPDDWIEAGARSASDVAHLQVERVLAEHVPGHVRPERVQAISDRFGLRLPAPLANMAARI